MGPGPQGTNGYLNKQEHSFRRRILAQAFSERALRDAEDFIVKSVQIFCDQLGAGAAGGWTPKKNLKDLATYFGFDFISDLAFGKSLDMMVKEEPRDIPNMLMQASQFIYYVSGHSTIPIN